MTKKNTIESKSYYKHNMSKHYIVEKVIKIYVIGQGKCLSIYFNNLKSIRNQKKFHVRHMKV